LSQENSMEFRDQIGAGLHYLQKLLLLNSQKLAFDKFDFSETNIDALIREIAEKERDRVALCNATKLSQCYRLEFNYNYNSRRRRNCPLFLLIRRTNSLLLP